LDANIAARYIEERFLDCAHRHPSQKERRMEEKNRQAPLGMTGAALGSGRMVRK
jgi:hypothetical protein